MPPKKTKPIDVPVIEPVPNQDKLQFTISEDILPKFKENKIFEDMNKAWKKLEPTLSDDDACDLYGSHVSTDCNMYFTRKKDYNSYYKAVKSGKIKPVSKDTMIFE